MHRSFDLMTQDELMSNRSELTTNYKTVAKNLKSRVGRLDE
jgi:hypothetical protein